MSPDTLFHYANMAALLGWALLLASPRLGSRLGSFADRAAGLVIPALLAIAYTGLVLAFWSGTEGGFGSLEAVARLFRSRELLLAGWLHYLAFDLFLGAWEVRAARRERIPFVLVMPCLVLTFLFGPAGFLLFLVLRAVRAPLARAVAV